MILNEFFGVQRFSFGRISVQRFSFGRFWSPLALCSHTPYNYSDFPTTCQK
ncbi:MAG: hypothetical protein KAI83_09210 [Thiomargarita sp.]|nr:hypothetical protein [Thiomargarita sp.]